MREIKLFKEADLSLEVVILLFGGMAMLILGLLLVVFALQIISMGKTPFGDIRRSATSVLFGVIIAAIGIVTCFIPDILGIVPRILLLLFFGAGGLVLFLHMLFAKDRYRLWRTYGGIFNHLIIVCGAVYLLQTLIAALIFKPNLLTGPQVASAALLYGLALVYLACVLQKITRRYPPAQQTAPSDGGLSINNATLLLMGIFMLLLGLLLLPVNIGLLPFSANGCVLLYLLHQLVSLEKVQ